MRKQMTMLRQKLLSRTHTLESSEEGYDCGTQSLRATLGNIGPLIELRLHCSAYTCMVDMHGAAEPERGLVLCARSAGASFLRCWDPEARSCCAWPCYV
jgi:hypothetical protein